jgi:hypothetical protein
MALPVYRHGQTERLCRVRLRVPGRIWDGWVGKHKDDLVKERGIPAHCVSCREVCEWERRRSERQIDSRWPSISTASRVSGPTEGSMVNAEQSVLPLIKESDGGEAQEAAILKTAGCHCSLRNVEQECQDPGELFGVFMKGAGIQRPPIGG